MIIIRRVNRFFSFFILPLILISASVLAHSLSKDIFTNHFEIRLGKNDKGTIYFLEDGSFTFMAAVTNLDYAHDCSGRWLFSEKNQTLKIGGSDLCKILHGTYSTSHEGSKIFITHPDKSFVLRKF
ncbi:MAG: hypothetical protein Q7T11_03090 [Deltaproteobacteria bacterium]|nr:hypothetical protein [Deltaproteobacteria bacterium]